jgi:hypothetical protein
MSSKKELKREIRLLRNELNLTEEMCELLNNTNDLNIQRTKFHLQQVELTTGEILMGDVEYCLNLGRRILDKMRRDFNQG